MKIQKLKCLLCENIVDAPINIHKIYCAACKAKIYSVNPALKASDKYRHSTKGRASMQRDNCSKFGLARTKRSASNLRKGISVSPQDLLVAKIRKNYEQLRELKKFDRLYHENRCAEVIDKYFQTKGEREKTFEDLEGINGNVLRFDIYYPQQNLLVEIQGAHHYFPVQYGSMTKEAAQTAFEKQKIHDRRKQAFCIDNKIKFVQIPFTFFTEEAILQQLKEQYENNYIETVEKEFHFCYAHRLNSVFMSDEDNLDIFGKCNNFNYHGHEVQLKVAVKGYRCPLTGMVINFNELKRIVHDFIDKIDHKNLNEDFGYFDYQTSTCENTLPWFWKELSYELPQLSYIELFETATSKSRLDREDVLNAKRNRNI